MGKFGDTMLPSNISPESLPDKCNEFFVHETEEIRSSFDPDRPIPTNPVEFSGTVFAEFQLASEDFVKTVVQEMPKKSCDLDPIPTSVLYDCLDEIIPIVTSIINKSLSSGILPQCFKLALVKPLLKKKKKFNKANLDPNCLKNYWPVSNLPFLSKVLGHIVLKQFLQPSRAVPVFLQKMSQHWNRLVVCSKWSTSGFRQWLCVYFVTAWPVGSLLHTWP